VPRAWDAVTDRQSGNCVDSILPNGRMALGFQFEKKTLTVQIYKPERFQLFSIAFRNGRKVARSCARLYGRKRRPWAGARSRAGFYPCRGQAVQVRRRRVIQFAQTLGMLPMLLDWHELLDSPVEHLGYKNLFLGGNCKRVRSGELTGSATGSSEAT
jgi:hypothetical protein